MAHCSLLCQNSEARRRLRPLLRAPLKTRRLSASPRLVYLLSCFGRGQDFFRAEKKNNKLNFLWLKIQKKKTLVSVKLFVRTEMAAPILWAPGKCVLSAGKTHVHKIPPFRGGGVFGGGVPILFYGREDFSEKMALLGPPFGPRNLEKSLCGSLFCPFPGNEAHINFSLGAPKRVFWAGAKRFYVEKVDVPFLSHF